MWPCNGSTSPPPGAGIVEFAVEQAHGSRAVEAADINSRFIQPFDSEGRHLLVEREVAERQSEVGKHILHGNNYAWRLECSPQLRKCQYCYYLSH